jgi:uncharacterized integral membrane protein
MPEVTMTASEPPPAIRSPASPAKPGRDRARIVAAAIIGALVAAFALLNLDDVRVHWIVATGQTPLILVILLAFALGMAADRLFVVRARRRRRARS